MAALLVLGRARRYAFNYTVGCVHRVNTDALYNLRLLPGGFRPRGQKEMRESAKIDVRYGSLADRMTSPRHVRFTPITDVGRPFMSTRPNPMPTEITSRCYSQRRPSQVPGQADKSSYQEE